MISQCAPPVYIGIEKQVVGFAYLRESGYELAHASFRDSARQWPSKPIRFAAKAPHIDKFYAPDFSVSSPLPDKLQDFRF
jgi:hypothetical protein